MRSIDKVLIANRGEIAVRIIRGAKKLGLKTVAVYSAADRGALHVREADEGVPIGAAPVGESYLVIDKIIEAAKSVGAGAIHPGYGFLAENAEFAQACADNGLIFVGPDPDAVELMGNKRASKIRMLEAGVPCVPGYEGAEQDVETLAAKGREVGFPLMIKAAAGGGGRGMRLCESAEQLVDSIKSARSEAENAFGSGELILEKAVIGARHVEIQVFGDRHGNVVHLGERDCSIQRRHQKVVEESPSPAVDPELRGRMGAAAVKAAAAIHYVGAGTVEFLLADNGEFYFLEMNTRLQVEHPVTEMVTGVDLVAWQFRVADGEPLPLSQEQIAQTGHAIEVRLCAEDPSQNYMPQTGPVLRWRPPQGEGVRVDHGLLEGKDVSPYYDSMLAKVIAHGHDRESARLRLRRALNDLVLHGVISNADFLLDIISEADFAAGEFHTGYMPAHFSQEQLASAAPSLLQVATAALVLYWDDAWKLYTQADFSFESSGWKSANITPEQLRLRWQETDYDVRLTHHGQRQCTLQIGDETHEFSVEGCDGFERAFYHNGIRQVARYTRFREDLWVSYGGRSWCYKDVTLEAAKGAEPGSDGRITATSDGKIIAVHVAPGDSVAKGQTLVVLEAMKMEFQLGTPVAGVVKAVNISAGDQVANRQLLVELEPAPEG